MQTYIIIIAVFFSAILSSEYGQAAINTSTAEGISTFGLRSERKIGAGLIIGGSTGLIGAAIDLNFESQNGVFIGVGFGSGFSSLGMAWKHVQDLGYLSAFTKVGYSRWYNSYGSLDYKNNSILKSVLTDEQKILSQFTTDFLVGGAGLQYTQIEGEFSGLSYIMELELIMDIHSSQLFPTGNIGSIYYF